MCPYGKLYTSQPSPSVSDEKTAGEVANSSNCDDDENTVRTDLSESAFVQCYVDSSEKFTERIKNPGVTYGCA